MRPGDINLTERTIHRSDRLDSGQVVFSGASQKKSAFIVTLVTQATLKVAFAEPHIASPSQSARVCGGNGVTDVKRDRRDCLSDVSRDAPAEQAGENVNHLRHELLNELMIPPTVVNASHPGRTWG